MKQEIIFYEYNDKSDLIDALARAHGHTHHYLCRNASSKNYKIMIDNLVILQNMLNKMLN